MRFMPIPGRPTPSAAPSEFRLHTLRIQGERIEWVEDRLQRSQQTWTHPPDYGIGDGKVRPIKELVRRRK
ncbi:hypothetical protein CFP56_026704 [Quercus suber]|uniref:Uncharacterized protein n=1 Tax=Quercus suber TaxID=58331 RepID=A0AAW0K0G0_QUESU